MVDPPPYKASGWLGIITAGALWSPLFDAGSLDTGIQLLMKQIRLAMPESGAAVSTAEPTMEEQDGELFTVDEMRSEVSAGCSWLQVQLFCVFVFCVLYFVFSLCDPAQLDRLRANLEEASITKKPKLVDPTGPCGLPAGVHGGTAFPRCAPSPPSNVIPTPSAAGVPELPIGLRVSTEMRQLATALLSATEGSVRVGFHGSEFTL